MRLRPLSGRGLRGAGGEALRRRGRRLRRRSDRGRGRSRPGRCLSSRAPGRRRQRPRRRSRSASPPARGRSRRGGRASRRAGRCPAQPIATSAWPRRQARPKLSETMMATVTPVAARISARMRRAEASGSSGSRQTVSGSGRLELSMPALAQTKPCRVSTIRTPRSARSTSLLSSRISSTKAGSLPSAAARRRASPPGQHRGEAADLSLGLGDDLLGDDDDVAVARARRSPRSARRSPFPRSTSGRPATGRT